MYLTHFGLKESPFGITPNPAFFYAGNTRGEILQALLYVVTHGEGIIKVTGEVGSGKTMLCRMLDEQLPAHIDVIYLVNPSLSPLEALFAIASELGIEPAGLRSDEVLRLLHADLIAKHSAGRQVVLLVEEAQAMPLATLEEIRLLTNLETARHKLLQIVLFGQPELDQHLNLGSMRQLKERITHSFTVPAMAAELIPEFLAFRLRAAGHQGGTLFDAAAIRLIARASQGIVRRINILADKALLAAFADDAATVQPRHVRQAARESAFRRNADPLRRASGALLLLIVVLLAAIAWLLARDAPPRPPGAGRAAAGPQSLVAASAALHAAALAPPAAPPSTPPLAPATSVAALAAPSAASPVAASLAGALAASAQPATPAPDAGNLLRATLAATKLWLDTAPSSRLCLEIATLPAGEHARIELFLRSARDAVGLEQIHAYPRRLGGAGGTAITIVYGSFAGRAEAEAMQTLLAQRWSYRPPIRALAAIRADLARADGAGPW